MLLYAQTGSTAEALCERAADCFDLDVQGDITVGIHYVHELQACGRKLVWAANFHAVFTRRLTLPEQVIPLRKCHLIVPATYPSWTLIGQAQGSVRLAYEGLQQAVPEVRRLIQHCPD